MVSCRRFAVQYCPLVMGKLNLMVDNSIVLFCKLHKEFLTDNFVLCSVFLGIPFIFVHVNSCPWRLQIWLVSAPVRCWSVSNCWCLSVTGIGGGSGDEGRGGDSASLCPRAAGHCWVSGDPPSPLCTSAEGEMGGSGEMETPVRPVSRAPPPYQISSPTQKAGKGWRKQSWRHHSTILSPLPILSPFSDQSCLWSGDWTRLLLQYRCWKWLCVCVNWLNFEQNRKKSP